MIDSQFLQSHALFGGIDDALTPESICFARAIQATGCF